MKTTVREELDIGIGEYATSGKGLGGRTKTAPEDFVVSEVLMDDSKKLIVKRGSGGYPLYVLCKWNSGTIEARERVQWITGIAMNTLGLKDKRALTYQFLSSRKKAEAPPGLVEEATFRASLVAETVRPLKKVDLLGNFFRIRIHSFGGDPSDVKEIGSLLDACGLPNFFGSQRFGRDKPNQKVGGAVVKRRFSEAAKILLEKEMSEAEAVLALRKVPLSLRRLLVQSYQSYLYNRMLSKVLERSGSLSEESAMYILKGRDVPVVLERYLRDPSEATAGFIPVPLGQLPGFAFRNRHDPYSVAMADVLEEEGLTPRDFFIKEMQELSMEGGYRPASIVGWFKGSRVEDYAEIRFGLYSGCYATVFLRELMKPQDPASSGL
jgi:tRNA pseudouridine13 synthase